MKVYVVIAWENYVDEEFVAAVFSTKEKAQHYCNVEADIDLGKGFGTRVECWEVQQNLRRNASFF